MSVNLPSSAYKLASFSHLGLSSLGLDPGQYRRSPEHRQPLGKSSVSRTGSQGGRSLYQDLLSWWLPPCPVTRRHRFFADRTPRSLGQRRSDPLSLRLRCDAQSQGALAEGLPTEAWRKHERSEPPEPKSGQRRRPANVNDAMSDVASSRRCVCNRRTSPSFAIGRLGAKRTTAWSLSARISRGRGVRRGCSTRFGTSFTSRTTGKAQSRSSCSPPTGAAIRKTSCP
jgi:hypothetical protein